MVVNGKRWSDKPPYIWRRPFLLQPFGNFSALMQQAQASQAARGTFLSFLGCCWKRHLHDDPKGPMERLLPCTRLADPLTAVARICKPRHNDVSTDGLLSALCLGGTWRRRLSTSSRRAKQTRPRRRDVAAMMCCPSTAPCLSLHPFAAQRGAFPLPLAKQGKPG